MQCVWCGDEYHKEPPAHPGSRLCSTCTEAFCPRCAAAKMREAVESERAAA